MNVIEIYIPSIAIATLFIAFIIQIFSRYVLRAPLIWPYEAAQLSYVTAILLGTCYTERCSENISFTILYDRLPPWLRKISDLLCYLIIVIVLALSLPSLVSFYSFFMTRFSVVLKIPLGIVYFPYLPFILITIGRFAYRFIHTLRTSPDVLYTTNESKIVHQEATPYNEH